ncbi:hypothetical protein Y1Q_0017107 [Alligator mississippiensis]|uniref:Uncharacterized protein n=1 Tax=Alligator mississippiensis TaxID=8496 RepID=A0A151P2U6_ALLMI|nr:hypothetical protein Y1Q_0017107 [Alligator mississippiensis]
MSCRDVTGRLLQRCTRPFLFFPGRLRPEPRRHQPGASPRPAASLLAAPGAPLCRARGGCSGIRILRSHTRLDLQQPAKGGGALEKVCGLRTCFKIPLTWRTPWTHQEMKAAWVHFPDQSLLCKQQVPGC